MANAKCEGKKPPLPPIGFIDPRGVLSRSHAPRALIAGENFSR
jgi:hypothetical protein